MSPLPSTFLKVDDTGLDFKDGNIVLVIAEHKYRVHSSALGAQSGVFADMFSIGSSSEMNKASIPVIKMHDEHEPFKLFLHALYNHDLEKYLPKLRKHTANLIAGTLDLVDKYNVSQVDMLAKFLPFIERDWPSTLAGWDANEDYIHHLSKELEEIDELFTLDDWLPDPATIIRFAHAYALDNKRVQTVPSYIPAAFYHLSRLPPFADPDDPTLNGGDFTDGLRTAKKSLLSHQDMECLLRGIYNLRLAAAQIAFVDFIHEAESFPGARDEEKESMIRWWRNVGIEGIMGPGKFDLLDDLNALVDELGKTHSDDPQMMNLQQGTGTSYREAMQTYLKKEREEQWATLIQQFSLYAFFY